MRLEPGHWHKVPAVRSGDQLTGGERAADRLKKTFGSWGFLIGLNCFIAVWVASNLLLPRAWDAYPFILLNLGLSWLAAQQGGALQIAANRGDRISSEVALHTYENGQELLGINKQQLDILDRLKGLHDDVGGLAQAVELVAAAQAPVTKGVEVRGGPPQAGGTPPPPGSA